MNSIKVFVTDGYWRKTLAAVRGLGRMSVRVTASESTWLSPALFSRHCARRVRTPSPILQPVRYLAFLERFLDRNPHDVLMPMEEDTLLLIAKHRERFEGKVRLPFAGHETLLFARDKLRVLKAAQAIGVPTPATFEFKSVRESLDASDALPYPVVIKPRVGSGSAGVRYASTRDQFLPAIQQAFASGPAPLVQERIPREGAGIGASFLIDADGGLRASFVHRRLREYPVEGGPSTLRESFRCDQALNDGLRLLRKLNFTGVAMVEFKCDPRDGKAKLMEVNPRFWGSLALAIDSGVNFPFLLAKTALGVDFPPVTEYKLGHRCRWLLPGDLLHFLSNPGRWRMDPGFFQFRAPDLTYDFIDPQDPLPALGVPLSLVPFYLSRDFAHVRNRRKT